jgi:adenosylmethionine-8-amino-7-oxononanoate aminotransferase
MRSRTTVAESASVPPVMPLPTQTMSGRRASCSCANELYERGHFTRPIGEVLQLVPPLSTAPHDAQAFLTDLYELLERR